MKTRKLASALMGAGLLASASMAQALLITSPFSGPQTVVTFDNFLGLETSGPVSVGPGVMFSGSPSTLGADIADLGNNGLWGAGKIFAGLGTSTSFGPGQMTFAFSSATSAVGAFVNVFAPTGSFTLSAFGESGDLLESYLIGVDTPGGFNEGRFVGIQRAMDIRSVSFSGTGVVLDDLTVAIPLPAGAWLLFGGLAMLGAAGRRKRTASAV